LATRELPSVGYFGNYNISLHSCSDTYGGIFETHSTAALQRLLFETADIDYNSSLEEKCSKQNDRRQQRLYAILLQVHRVGDFGFLTRPARDQ